MFCLRLISLLLVLTLSIGVRVSQGQTILVAQMNNFNEPVGMVLGTLMPTLSDGTTPRPASFGSATFVLAADMMSMTMTAEVHNIDFTGTQTADTNDDLTNAHIHASGTVTPTTNAGVVWGFIGLPFNETAPDDQVVTPFAMGVGGTVSGKWDALEGNGTTLAAQIDNILNGRAYINFHTMQFPAGEIRGTIVIPEPSAIALVMIGVFGWMSRRPKR